MNKETKETKQNTEVIKIKDFNTDNIIITEPKVNPKTNNFQAAILNATNKKPLLIEFAPTTVIYRIIDYQGNKKFSITIKNITNIQDSKEDVQKLFNSCEELNEMCIQYILDNKKTILKPKEASKITRDLAESPAFMGPCMTKDSRDEDQIKLNIMTDYDSEKPNLFVVVEKTTDNGNGEIKTTKETLNWDDYEDPWKKLQDIVKPGMHIQGVIQPRIYFVNSKVGINFKLHALKVSASSKNINDTEAINLDIDHVGFSDPKLNKDNKWNALVLNTSNKTAFGKIIGSYHRCIYGVSKYESQAGTNDYSIYIKKETDLPQEQQGVENLFDFSSGFIEKGIDYIMEHKDTLFKQKESKKMTREIAESAYFNSVISTDKEGVEQIKLKIMKTIEGDLPNFTLIEEIIDGKEIKRNEIDWTSYDEPWEELRRLVRAGMHIKPIIQPRIYIVNSKVGISYRLVELIVQKSPQKRFDASTYSFSGDNDVEYESNEENEEVEEEEDNESEEVIEEEDPEAYGINSDEEDVDEEAESEED